MPVRQSYSDRVFTTSIVSYPEMVHIGEDKDFTPVIEKAIACKGYDREKPLKGINGRFHRDNRIWTWSCIRKCRKNRGFSEKRKNSTFLLNWRM